MTDYPQLISLRSNQVGDVVCNTEELMFIASSTSTNVLYHFFIDGISIQGPSTLSTLSHTISTAVTATLITSLNGCSRIITLPMHHISFSAGSIIGGGNYCFGDSPSVIRNVQFGTYNGSQITSSTSSITYQWESSIDGNIWNDIIGANHVEYTPPSLTQTTHFRRKIVVSSNGKTCSLIFNPITITVVPNLSAGTIDQSN